MYAGDWRWAVFAVAALWATYGFVFWKVLPLVSTPEVIYALAVSAGIVLLFNTASIVAMISHYSGDKEHIYGLDIHYLDAIAVRLREGHMAKAPYQPPEQSKVGQIINSLFLLVLVVASLLRAGLLRPRRRRQDDDRIPRQDLGGHGTERDHAGAVGEARLHAGDGARHDRLAVRLRFQHAGLIVTALVVIVYFVFVFRLSAKEYKDVITERFDR